MDIWTGTGIWSGWRLTTNHSASSYNQPVLVDPDGKAYAPDDILAPDLVGQKEICNILGWSKQQVSNYYNNNRLPDPYQVVAGRPLWTRQQIEDYRDRR